MRKEILLVIDAQNCFVPAYKGWPGGSLATVGEAPDVMAAKINSLIKSGQFAEVYFSQDMHHPQNISMMNMHNLNALRESGDVFTGPSGLPAYKTFYKLKNMREGENVDQYRRWISQDQLVNQNLWPRHCIIPEDDPFYPKGATNTRVNKSKNPTMFNKSGEINGADLVGVLNNYKNGRPEGVAADIYHVYKGFSPDRDSYSAVADAYGNFDPFIAKVNGVAQPNQDNKFAKMLLGRNDITDIHVCGIARDFCVYWTAMDLIDLILFGQKEQMNLKPKIHYLWHLTRPVVTDKAYAMTKKTLATAAYGFLNKVISKQITRINAKDLFVIEDIAEAPYDEADVVPTFPPPANASAKSRKSRRLPRTLKRKSRKNSFSRR